MSKNSDPLAVLISNDTKATDREKLAELLMPYIVFDEKSKEFSFHPAIYDVGGNGTKIEILLAGAKARALYFELQDGLLPGEIIATGIMPEGSVKSSLKRLFDHYRVKRDKDGRYFLPAHRIQDLAKKLSNHKDNNE